VELNVQLELQSCLPAISCALPKAAWEHNIGFLAKSPMDDFSGAMRALQKT
jgi:hypothetical protein